MPTHRVEGIVIKRTNYSEADRILTIFTKNRGKVAAIAKGSRKITSRKGGHIELLSHSLFSLAEGKNLYVVSEAETIEPFREIKENLDKSGLGYYIAEFINEFVREEQRSYPLFRLCLMALGFLNDASEGAERVLVRAFELKALAELGFAPEIRKCVLCGQPLTWGECNAFSSCEGGVICSHCSAEDCVDLDEDILELLRETAFQSWKKISRIDVGERPVDRLEALVRSYVEFVLERRLESTELLKKLRNNKFRRS